MVLPVQTEVADPKSITFTLYGHLQTSESGSLKAKESFKERKKLNGI